ncbi:hypothetical protein AAVH_37726, partial [Aphelenchoides avenae]
KQVSQRYAGDWSVVVTSDGDVGFSVVAKIGYFLYVQTTAAPRVNFVIYRSDYRSN